MLPTSAALAALGALLPLAARAALLPECTKDGNCDLQQFLSGFINLANYGLGLLGILGVGMLIWGGMYWLLSAGRSTMVARGKAIIAGAITGILIVLFSWVAIGFVYIALTGDPSGTIFAGTKSAFSFIKTGAGKDEEPFQKNLQACSPAGPTYLQKGCTESDGNGPVHKASTILNSKPECSVGEIKGTFDAAMETAVKAFQTANLLTVDGIIGPQTWDKLHQGDTTCIVTSVVRTGCCISSNLKVGSCAVGARAGGPTGTGQCGAGFTFSGQACDDLSQSGNLYACTAPVSTNDQWGTCSYAFQSTASGAPPAPQMRTWRTGTLACNAVGGTIPAP